MRSLIYILCSFLAFYVPMSVSVSPKVVCYMANRSRYRPSPMSYLPDNIPAKDCDVLVYVYLIVNKRNWKLDSRDRDADYYQGGYNKTAALKSVSPGIKLVIAVGGYGSPQGEESLDVYSDMMASPETRNIFVKSARSLLQNKRFDGLLLHWYSHPGVKDNDNYVQLIKELHQEFSRHKLDLYARVPFHDGHFQGGFNVTEMSKYLTALHVSTVDMIVNSGKNTADNSSPLYRRSFDVPGSEQYYQNVKFVLEYYERLGVPKEKLIFGVSTSGHSFILRDIDIVGLDSPIIGRDTRTERYSKTPGIFFYYEICANIQSGKWISRRDKESGIPYAYNPSTGQWISYDDQDTITAKAHFAKSGGYGGIFLWMVDQDDFRGLCGEKHGLLRTLVRELKGPDDEGDRKRLQQDATTTSTAGTTTTSTVGTTLTDTTTDEKVQDIPSTINKQQRDMDRARETLMNYYGNRLRSAVRDIQGVYSRSKSTKSNA